LVRLNIIFIEMDATERRIMNTMATVASSLDVLEERIWQGPNTFASDFAAIVKDTVGQLAQSGSDLREVYSAVEQQVKRDIDVLTKELTRQQQTLTAFQSKITAVEQKASIRPNVVQDTTGQKAIRDIDLRITVMQQSIDRMANLEYRIDGLQQTWEQFRSSIMIPKQAEPDNAYATLKREIDKINEGRDVITDQFDASLSSLETKLNQLNTDYKENIPKINRNIVE
jgi:hypothetical protein